jgi:hypothetical protein
MASKTIEDKLREGRQYRNIDLAGLELKAEDEGAMVVEGYASTFNDPYQLLKMDNFTVREQIDPHAFDAADMSDIIMQYNHEGRVFARTGNGTLTVNPDEHGLHIRADLSGTELGRQVFEEIRGGYTNKMSFGFRVAEDRREETENRETNEVDILRTITKIEKLYDVSAVSIPANDATSISARTDGEGVIAEVAEELRKREAERLHRERQRQKIRIMLEVNK